jgi:hypothetical protein
MDTCLYPVILIYGFIFSLAFSRNVPVMPLRPSNICRCIFRNLSGRYGCRNAIFEGAPLRPCRIRSMILEECNLVSDHPGTSFLGSAQCRTTPLKGGREGQVDIYMLPPKGIYVCENLFKPEGAGGYLYPPPFSKGGQGGLWRLQTHPPGTQG